MTEDLYIKADTTIPPELQGQWFKIPHPEYLALPWWKKLWQQCRWRYWGWKNRNAEWTHVMPNWDGPRRVYFNIGGEWSVWESDGTNPERKE